MGRPNTSLPAGILATALVVGIAAERAHARVVMFVPPAPPRFDARVAGLIVSRRTGPPPISGGTLLPLADGSRLVASDPDRDRILLVDLDTAAVLARVERLARGAEPGRATLDGAGRVHVVLRGAGAIVSFDPTSARDHAIRGEQRAVCPMPRGIAWRAADDTLLVACRGGELVTLVAAGGAPTRTARLDRDLRDVVIARDRIHVARFRSAELLELDDRGAIVERRRPGAASHDEGTFEPAVAWRTIVLADGSVAMLHQRANRDEVQASIGGYGTLGATGCDGIVRSAITMWSEGIASEGVELAQVLPVDLAVLDGEGGAVDRMAVVAAGNESGESSVIFASAPPLRTAGCIGSTPPALPEPITNPIAAAYARDRRLVVQQRDPARLTVVSADGARVSTIALGGETVFDSGHAIFHASTGAGIACASCHPEGGEDGRTWRLTGIGARRTPALHSIRGSAPFHWSGELADVRALMNEVFVIRMRGEGIGPDHAGAVEAWLGHVPAPRTAGGDAAAIARGRALFEGEADCADCHSGARLERKERRRRHRRGVPRALVDRRRGSASRHARWLRDHAAPPLRSLVGGAQHGSATLSASRRSPISSPTSTRSDGPSPVAIEFRRRAESSAGFGKDSALSLESLTIH